MTFSGEHEETQCGGHRSIRGEVWRNINCAWEQHLTRDPSDIQLCHKLNSKCSFGLKLLIFDIHTLVNNGYERILEAISIVDYSDKGNAEEDPVEIVLCLINEHVQCVFLGHFHKSLWIKMCSRFTFSAKEEEKNPNLVSDHICLLCMWLRLHVQTLIFESVPVHL